MIAWLRTIVEDPRTERVIMALIIVNAVVLGLETSKTVMASSGRLLEIIDHVILAVFVIEITARIVVHRWAFFRDPWSLFDFIVVGIALVPATETFSVPVRLVPCPPLIRTRSGAISSTLTSEKSATTSGCR